MNCFTSVTSIILKCKAIHLHHLAPLKRLQRLTEAQKWSHNQQKHQKKPKLYNDHLMS